MVLIRTKIRSSTKNGKHLVLEIPKLPSINGTGNILTSDNTLIKIIWENDVSTVNGYVNSRQQWSELPDFFIRYINRR
jgi:hypothetical protein